MQIPDDVSDRTPPIRDAASVVLIRDTQDGPEAFTLTRASTMAFSAGATVFPGGGVDPGDALPDADFDAVDLPWWAAAFDDDEDAVRRLLVTAVRETFEECGVLLARTSDGGGVDPRAYDAARQALEAHETTLAEVFEDHDLRPDFSVLRPFSRWTTPVDQPRRYDTRFFLAALPSGQQAVHTTGEAVATRWMGARRAAELFRDGDTDLMPPTWSQFRELGRWDSVETALAAADEAPPPRVTPTIVPDSSPRRVRFPHDEEYYADSPAHLTPGS
ncbi:MAG: NUDIX hydrolase [Nesterenkonia sp.]|uniref:NUDIX hydrolase n=1 Tax=Nesterenkonia marinintestina TaxID=2979865 RepID=UPI0021C214C1|nr:NUDIX hydrolase [Nesterenkonia sp. GX14115]MDO5493520.1 NUDIX hydrolase [Nesterenkonia sp.]